MRQQLFEETEISQRPHDLFICLAERGPIFIFKEMISECMLRTIKRRKRFCLSKYYGTSVAPVRESLLVSRATS